MRESNAQWKCRAVTERAAKNWSQRSLTNWNVGKVLLEKLKI